MALAAGFELSSCLFCLGSHKRGSWHSLWWGMGARSVVATLVWKAHCCPENTDHPKNEMWMNCPQDLDGLRGNPPLTTLFRTFQNECMKIWSLLRSGKFSCPTNKQPINGPDGKRDLNKCLMCQRLLWVSSARPLRCLLSSHSEVPAPGRLHLSAAAPGQADLSIDLQQTCVPVSALELIAQRAGGTGCEEQVHGGEKNTWISFLIAVDDVEWDGTPGC